MAIATMAVKVCMARICGWNRDDSKRVAVRRCGTPPNSRSSPRLSSRNVAAHFAADIAEHGIELGAHNRSASRSDEGDQDNKETVFDHRCAALVLAEAVDQCKHGKSFSES